MKLTELIYGEDLETRVEDALKKMDWNFDIDATDDVRLTKGNKALKTLEALVGSLHNKKPELAQALWEAYCPYAQPGSLSASMFRL